MLKSVRWADNTVALPELGNHHSHSQHDHDHIFGELDLDTASRAASNTSAHKLKMRLVQRPQITTLALPRSSTWPSEAVPATQAPWHFIPDVMSFSKFMLATSDYMLAELQHNLRELEQERILLEGDDLGKSFVDAAIRHVSGQMEKAKTEMDTPALRKAERETREACAELEASHRAKVLAGRERKERVDRKDQDESAPAEAMTPVPLADIAAPPVTEHQMGSPVQQPPTPAKSKNRRGNPRVPQVPHDEPSYLYYQAASGANVYLHPLDIKILLAHYKTYNAFPDTITIRPEGADEGTINEDLRRRCKYLAHLQMGTDVVFVEADLEDTLGPEAVAQFEQPLKQRRNRRRERIKKEDKAKLKWEAQEREKMPFGVRTAIPNHSGDADEDFLLALQRSTVEMGPATSTTGASSSAVGGSEVSSSPTMYDLGTSFPPSSGNTRISSSGVGLSVSPPAGAWASSASAHNKSFASALHAPPGTRSFMPQRNPETDWEIERAWSAFEESARAATTPVDGHGAAADSVGATGGKGGKKAKPKKLVLSMSSGGRRA
jgi:predicted phage tail protein